MKRLSYSCLLLVALLAVSIPASAVSYAFLPTEALFTPSGELSFGAPSSGTLDFILLTTPLTSVNLTNVGDQETVEIGSLELNETTISAGTVPGSAGMTVGFTLLGVPSFSLEAAAVLAFTGPAGDDPGFPEAVISFAGVTNVRQVSPLTAIQAEILAGNAPQTASNPASFDGANSTQNFYARLTLVDVPEPATVGLSGVGLLLMAWGLQHRRRRV